MEATTPKEESEEKKIEEEALEKPALIDPKDEEEMHQVTLYLKQLTPELISEKED